MFRMLVAVVVALTPLLAAMAQSVPPVSAPSGKVSGSPNASFDANPIQTDLGGMRASRIIGMPVYNDAQEKIGSVDDLVVGADRAVHAIISVGGFLGFGSKMVEVAYQKLQFSNAKGMTNRVVLPGATKQSLSTMRSFNYSRQG